MRNTLSRTTQLAAGLGLSAIASLAVALPGWAEGSQQLGSGDQGLNVYLFEYNATNNFIQTNQGPRPIRVNVDTAGQVINISLCGWSTGDDLAIEVFRPSGAEISYSAQVATGSPGSFRSGAADGAGAWLLTQGNAQTATQTTLCTNQNRPNQPSGVLTTPVRFIAPEAGTYEIRLYNDSEAANSTNNVFTYFDITVTPNASINPDPRSNDGRVWATSWALNAGNTFGVAGGYDADLYVRVPGGRPNTEFIWQLDLNNFAPQRHEIVANGIGLNSPYSRYSIPGSQSGNTGYTKSYPIYLSPPSSLSTVAPILPEPAPPVLSNLRFIDNAGEDNTISPNSTSTIQDSGFFRFETDVFGTYEIIIDTNRDGVFGTGDPVLFGTTTPGTSSVQWDGRGFNNAVLPAGTYNAQVRLRIGEYHFVAYDAETSGGGTSDGLSIWKWKTGSRSQILNFWDDATYLGSFSGATTNLTGGLSGTPAGTHTWGNFNAGSIGDTNYIDTWVFGFPQVLQTPAILADVDTFDSGDAPDTYGTDNIANNSTNGSDPVGPRHGVPTNPTVYLGGIAPDVEGNAVPPLDGTGDGPEDDAFSSFPSLTTATTSYSLIVPLRNTSGRTATLAGWIDFDRDGIFQADEGVTATLANDATTATLTWNTIGSTGPNIVAGPTYARFRLTTDALTTSNPAGFASNGEVEDYAITITPPTYSLSGRVWNDVDGNGTLNAPEAGTEGGSATLTVYAINGNGNVAGKADVSGTDGTYTIPGLAAGNYTLRLSNDNSVAIGAAAPVASLPTNWENTGENVNGTIERPGDGAIAVTITSANLVNQNFGIEQRPVAQNNTNASQPNPGGTTQAPVAATSFTTNASDSDGGSIVSYQISFPTGADSMTINGVNYTADSFATAFPAGFALVPVTNIGTVTVDPAGTGSATVVIPFRPVDNAGVASSTLYNATIPFGPPLVPRIVLVKRITNLNATAFLDVLNDPNDPNDDPSLNWPTNYLQGKIGRGINSSDQVVVKPTDIVEYTIYFLSNGNATANNVRICDRIPDNTTFVPDAFNQSGSPSDRGISLSFNGSTQALTNVPDSDIGQYFAPGSNPISVYPTINCGGSNTNGAVVVNLGNLPAATAPNTPPTSYGFVRFRGRIK
jgi:uncharacterized repeat protein (TIGR01451 family)